MTKWGPGEHDKLRDKSSQVSHGRGHGRSDPGLVRIKPLDLDLEASVAGLGSKAEDGGGGQPVLG